MKKKETFVNQLQDFLEKQGLEKDEAKNYLTEVFMKAFGRDRDALSRYDEEEPEPAIVDVQIDMEKGSVSITRTKNVVEEKTIIGRFTQIEVSDEEIEDKDLSIGDKYIEKIDLDEINNSKRQHIKQLFLQKLSEIEKAKVYARFSKFKGELLSVKVHRILNRGNVILEYKGDTIFMPANEIPHPDKETIKEGDFITIYVLEIEEPSRDPQIIATRRNPQFISKLIEREIDDVADGTVVIEAISREAGFKTKVAVSSTLPDVDPVGSIIGVKGQKIKPILTEINGERLDVIKYHEDDKQFIAGSLLPAEIVGIKVTETEDLKEVVIVVEQDQFLPAIGKRGINIKLAAIITKSRIDVKTIAEANEEGIEWEKITKEKRSNQSFNKFEDNIEYGDFSSIEDLADSDISNFNDDDYNTEEIRDFSKNYGKETEENIDEEYEEEYGSK